MKKFLLSLVLGVSFVFGGSGGVFAGGFERYGVSYVGDIEKTYVMYENGNILKDADPYTFTEILKYINKSSNAGHSYGKDINYIYYNDKQLGFINNEPSNSVLVPYVNIDTFTILGDGYSIDTTEKLIFYKNNTILFKDIPLEIKNKYFEYLKDFKCGKLYVLNGEKCVCKNGYSEVFSVNMQKNVCILNSEYFNGNLIFSDVNNENLYFSAINYVKTKNLVKGYSDGTYRPENPITRAEFTKIILLAKYSQDEIDSVVVQDTLDDNMNEKNWYFNYINFAWSNEIVKGYSDGTFRPNQNITFAEASKIIVNVLLDNPSLNSAQDPSKWWTPYIEKLAEKNIDIEKFTPEKNLTRGQMAELIYGLRDFVK